MRSGIHEGFDRVVFEFSGDGRPSWRAEYVESAAELGRGNPIPMAGGVILQIGISGPSWLPEEAVQDQVTSGEYYERDTGAIFEEVYIQGPFEAHSQYLIGLPDEVPFSVGLLEDPTRLVVDLENRDE
ncbi:AMIN-like domain-containing (lipo)protein [Nesterenkonia lutea]|uniref:AMIN-like domain-containing (lipo)protein n=1 Tax=Nesterenkonia lutea TaxID=272919 RepID=UPI0031DF9E65